MALYYIGKSERDIEDTDIFAGSETIYGMNENENYATFSLSDEDKHEELDKKRTILDLQDMRFGMEKFKLFDDSAKFVFNDKELFEKVMKQTEDEMMVTKNDVIVVSSFDDIKK